MIPVLIDSDNLSFSTLSLPDEPVALHGLLTGIIGEGGYSSGWNLPNGDRMIVARNPFCKHRSGAFLVPGVEPLFFGKAIVLGIQLGEQFSAPTSTLETIIPLISFLPPREANFRFLRKKLAMQAQSGLSTLQDDLLLVLN